MSIIDKIPERDLPVVSPASGSRLRAVTASGKSTLVDVESLPVPADVNARLSAVESGQVEGLRGYATLVAMTADTSAPLNSLGLVTNDPVVTNNGTYRKVGSSTWEKSVDRVADIDVRLVGAENVERYGLKPALEYNSINPTYFTVTGFTRSVVSGVVRYVPDGAGTGAGWLSRAGLSINPVTFPVVSYRLRRIGGTARRSYLLFLKDSSGGGHYYGIGEQGAMLQDSSDWHEYTVDISKKPDGSAWGGLTITELWVSLSDRSGDSSWDIDYVVVGKPGDYAYPQLQQWRSGGGTTLERMRSDLYDPMRSVTIQLIGDSITWGTGATGAADAGGGRNNLTSPCWANLLHKWLGESFSGGALTPSPGTAEYRAWGFIPVVNVQDRGAPQKLYTVGSNGERKPLETTYNDSAYSDYIAQFRSSGVVGFNGNSPVNFRMRGDNITVVFSPRDAADAAGSIVELWGNGKKLGEFSYYGATAWGETHAFSFPIGDYEMQLVNKSTTNTFVLEGLRHNRLIKVMNEGVPGSGLTAWVEGSAYLTAALAKHSDYVFVQLGTNDRVGVDPWIIYFYSSRIIKAIQSAGRSVVAMAANAVAVGSDYPENTGFNFGQRDIARVMSRVAYERGVSFIDNHQATVMERIDGTTFTIDGLHPNDHGYRLIFDNIRLAIERVG